MGKLKTLLKDINGDLKNGKSFLKAYFYDAGFRVLLNHRIGKFFSFSKFALVRQIANRYRYKLISKRSCDISYSAEIGKGLSLPHPIGIVIGEKSVIKNNVKIFQNVTLGSHGKKGEENQYPIIEDNVVLYAGAKLIGGITIGKNAIVGANSVVNIDVPPDSIAVGIPCKILKKNE